MASNKLVVEYGSVVPELGEPFKIFTKYVRIFDLYFVATPKVPDDKLLHGATIVYQYKDNDGDGAPDNPLVYSQLVKRKATMVMFLDMAEQEKYPTFYRPVEELGLIVQDLQACETNIPGEFDAALEECLHFVQAGYGEAYPRVFGDKRGSMIADCCDTARGGCFERPPKKYPSGAWFTYYDQTCDYECQITEYMYWALTSILGAQKSRTEVLKVWKLNTPALVRSGDPLVYALLTDPTYHLPTRLPSSKIPPSNLKTDGAVSKVAKACCGCIRCK